MAGGGVLFVHGANPNRRGGSELVALILGKHLEISASDVAGHGAVLCQQPHANGGTGRVAGFWVRCVQIIVDGDVTAADIDFTVLNRLTSMHASSYTNAGRLAFDSDVNGSAVNVGCEILISYPIR